MILPFLSGDFVLARPIYSSGLAADFMAFAIFVLTCIAKIFEPLADTRALAATFPVEGVM